MKLKLLEGVQFRAIQIRVFDAIESPAQSM
jgi:hypothetical protein